MLFLALILLFCGCEDNKKAAETEEINTSTEGIDTVVSSSEKQPKEKTASYPFLTNANVEDFLTAYGKEHTESKVLLKTSHGDIALDLYNDTPLHRANFVYMIKNGYLNTTMFHRVIDGFMIQGGNSDYRNTARMRSKLGKYTIPAEIKYKHHRGALASAKEYRENPDDRSSSFEFYIVQNPKGAHHLDPNYTVFGKVISGMDVVDKIAKLETDEGDWPLQNVFITAEFMN